MNTEIKRKRGRPVGSTASNTASEKLPMVRVTTEQLAKYRDAAESSNQKFSQWVRSTLDKAIE